MSLYAGHLRNSSSDIVVDMLVSASIVAAWAYQITSIWNGQIQGISSHYLLFNAISTNIVLSFTFLNVAFAYPDDRNPVLELIENHRLKGKAAFGAILGLVQVALHWTCSTMMVVLYIMDSQNGTSLTGRIGIGATVFIHAALVLFPAAWISVSKRRPHEMGKDFIIGIISITQEWVPPICIIVQYYAQYLEIRRATGEPGCLCLYSLKLQILVFVAIAIRWLLRLGRPSDDFLEFWRSHPFSKWTWICLYQWGFTPFNYVLQAIGCAFLLGIYS